MKKQPLITLKKITLKQFLKGFIFNRPDFSNLPDGFPYCDLTGLDSPEVGKYNAIVALWNLSLPPKIISRSRIWQDPDGYQYLGVWQNAALLRVLIRKCTSTVLPLPDNTLNQTLKTTLKPPFEYRLKSQMDDTARSIKRNFEEGWKRPTTAEYLQFLGYSQASLGELRGDIRDCKTDGFLPSKPLSSLKSTLNINLRVIKGPYKGNIKGEPTDPSHPYYQSLSTLNPHTLTYEIFIELVNKTDWLLRKLVESLENKLNHEQKFYMIEKARITNKAKGMK